MGTTINKIIGHSLLIEEGDLQSLYGLICSKYDSAEVVMRCVDGSRIETKDLDEITAFDNPDYRRIWSLSMEARTGSKEKISLSIMDDRLWPTAVLEIDSQSDEKAVYISQEILKKLSGMKAWYDWFARAPIGSLVLVSTLLLLAGILAILLTSTSLVLTPASASPLFAGFLFGALGVYVLFGAILLLERARQYLFPKVFFLIGKQKRKMRLIETWRRNVFGGILLAVIVGFIANAISRIVLK